MKPLAVAILTSRIALVLVLLFFVWVVSSCLPTVTITETRPDGYKKVTETRGGIDGQAFAAGASLAGQVIGSEVHADK